MDFKAYLDKNADFLDASLASCFEGQGCHPDMQKYLYEPLAVYTANAGKRHRPLICLLGCSAVGGNPEDALFTATAIENFHTAALIHDDIADDALLRRGKPCMHLSEGLGLAINCGDLSLSLVNGTVIRDPRLAPEVKLRVLQEVIDMTARTVEGQALDIGWAKDERFDISIEDYLVMATHKTAFYSGGVPLACGAIIGGGNEEQIEALRKFGMATGLAFQIQDDLLNLLTSEEEASKDFRGDITEGKRTLIAVHAIQNSAPAEREELISILAAHTTDREKMDRAVEIMEKAGSLTYAHNYALMISNEAKADIERTLPDTPQRALLLSMADFFVERLS